jgi:hypothetical protein
LLNDANNDGKEHGFEAGFSEMLAIAARSAQQGP